MATTHKQLRKVAKPSRPVRIIDIASAGSLKPADATARPVIVRNRPIMQDPMMAPFADTTAAQPAKQPATRGPALTTDISPATSPDHQDQTNSTGSAGQTDATGQSQPDGQAETESPDTGLAQTAVDKAAADLEADAKAEDELDNLVDAKTYFLPIDVAGQRSRRHVMIFGIILILILAAAWLDIALDAGFVTVNHLRPLTHFFRQ